jgi:hypothetical protein
MPLPCRWLPLENCWPKEKEIVAKKKTALTRETGRAVENETGF